MTITFDKGRFIARSIFDENELLRQTGFKWDTDSKRWTTTDYLIAEKLLTHCENTAIFQIKFLKEGMQKAVLQSASSQGVGNFSIYHPKDIKPFPYQIAGVEYMLPRPAVLLADEMGLGKTGEALLVMNMRNPVEVLIVCPSILKYNWLKEARKWMIGKITAYVYESKKIRYYEGRVTNHNKNTILHIINYDILDKFKDRLLGTPFNFFVADECFVYDTLIETNIGSLKIGDVIDKRLPVKILSYNHSTKQTEYKAITRYIKHEKKYKNLVRVTLSNGKSLTCTEEHKFFVNGKYTKICEVKSGDNLFLLQGEVDERQKREIDCQILFNKMCEYSQQLNFIKEGVGIDSILEAKNTNDLSVLPTAIYLQGKNRRKKEDVLLNAMFGEMENATARNITKNESAMERQVQAQDNFKKKTSGQSSLSISIFVTNEAKQSNDKSSFGRKNETENDRKNIFIKGWEWADNYSTKETARGVEFTRKQFGICHTNERSSFYVPISSPLLQSRYSDSRNKISNRSRWQISQNEKMDIFGQEENRNIECVRVESIKVLERGDIDGYRTGKDGHINLYDIEVEDNHNYFANDVLVSNCHYIKNQDAKRTKIAQELARKAKWKIFITGTPIYNKPKDLYVALNLIDPAMFDNFFSFATRYCGAKKVKFNNKSIVKYEGPTNVEELNTILRANYMVRRMKKDVLKDLPDKIKDVIILNESDLDVLVQKEKKAVEESKQNEERLKAEAEELKALAVTNKEFENLYKDKVKTLREIKFKNFGELSRIRKEIAIKKIPYVIEFVKEILDSSEDEQSKIVVFGHHKEVLYKIYEELKKYNPVIITGEVSDGERQRAIMLFKEKNPTRVFIGSMGAAGTGVDGLQQNCNTIVFAELDWTPALVDQAESRLQRIGQKNTVWVYHIVANESIDSRIVKLMMEKEAVSKEILDYRPEQVYDAVIRGK